MRSASRIVLEIDPTVPPAEVDKAYREAQRAFRGPDPTQTRFRPVLARDLHALAFALEHDGLGANELLEAWNAGQDCAQHSDWRFSKAETMARQVRAARRKLTDPFG